MVVKYLSFNLLEKFPTYVEYVPNNKRNSLSNQADKTAYSNPESSNNIQAIQRVIRLNKNPLSSENRKFSTKSKLSLKHLTDVI